MIFSYIADPSDIREEDETNSGRTKVSARIELTIIFGICVYVFFGVASEQGYASMIAVYVIQSLGMSKSSAAFVVSTFWAAFTLSRIVATFLSIRMKPTLMLGGSHLIMMLAAVILFILPKTEWIIWSMTALFAFGLSPFFGNICSWTLQYVFLNHNYMAAIMLSVCVGAMVPPIIVGPFIERHPVVFMYANISFSTLMAITTVCLLLFGGFIKREIKAKSEHEHREQYAAVKATDISL